MIPFGTQAVVIASVVRTQRRPTGSFRRVDGRFGTCVKGPHYVLTGRRSRIDASAKSTPASLKLSARAPVRLSARRRSRVSVLCQNCVTYRPKPWANTVIYGETLKQIVVAGNR
jgi:hypothetical protein